MLNLFLALILVCGSFGVVISKTTTDYGVKKNREHTNPLQINREVA